ncbi:putative membrane protein [compost metagenome]
MTQALGALPALLGFSVPTVEMIRASGDAALNIESARQAWAGWLVGVVLVYGVVPRLLLALFCLWRWTSSRAGLHLDLSLPGYAQLRERLMPSSERLGVNDAAPEQLHPVNGGASALDSDGALLVAIELDDQRPWPPQLPGNVKDAGILDSRESRHKLLEQLTRFPPARLAIACDPRRSPDRGSLALIAELARCASATRVWLLQAPAGQALDAERLGDWHEALQQLQLPVAECAPMNWLESGHD